MIESAAFLVPCGVHRRKRQCRRCVAKPGRGARHVPGQSQPDTWVPMDGSFKQYTFKPGMDLSTAVPLDANALMNAAQQGAQINQAEGWVQNLNTAALQSVSIQLFWHCWS